MDEICADTGLHLNPRKTRVMGRGGRQRTGHTDFRAHLDGQIAWIESVNLRNGARLRQMCEVIE